MGTVGPNTSQATDEPGVEPGLGVDSAAGPVLGDAGIAESARREAARAEAAHGETARVDGNRYGSNRPASVPPLSAPPAAATITPGDHARAVIDAVLPVALDGSAGDGPRTLREAAFDALLPRAGRVVAGKYRVDELMARGGMGAVYAATHQVTGKRVAIKWMLPSFDSVPAATERFVREAQATARINHPNVVDIYDVGQEGSSFYLVMELLHGETLRARMRHGPMAPHESIALLMPALRGVAAAHAHRVVHRDLKPDNIFLCAGTDGEQREAKVLDFGISKVASDSARDVALTQSGTVLGTPYYMAPEQVRGLRDVDARADVYAFGVILYELLSGRRPFEADSYNGLILQIATERPVPLHLVMTDVPEALSDVVHRALARSPSERFQTVTELAAALEPFAAGVSFRMSQSRSNPLYSMPTPLSRPAFSAPSLAASHPAGKPPRSTPAAPAPIRSFGRKRWFSGLLALLGTAVLAVWLIRSRIDTSRAPQPPDHRARNVVSDSVSAHGLAPAAAAVGSTPAPSAPSPSAPEANSVATPVPNENPSRPGAESVIAAPAALAPAEVPVTRGHRRASVRPGGRATSTAPSGAQPAAATTLAGTPAAEPDSLPDDWDMRLRPANAAPKTETGRHPAGSLGEADFR